MKRIEIEGQIEMGENEGGYCSPEIAIDGHDLAEIILKACGKSYTGTRGFGLPVAEPDATGYWDTWKGPRVRIIIEEIGPDSGQEVG